MLITHVLPLSCYRKKLQNFSHINCGLQIHQIWIQLITACGEYCKRKCTNMSHWSERNERVTENRGGQTILSSLWQPFVSGFVDKSRSVYIILQQIYSGNYLSDFIRIAHVIWQILPNNGGFEGGQGITAPLVNGPPVLPSNFV